MKYTDYSSIVQCVSFLSSRLEKMISIPSVIYLSPSIPFCFNCEIPQSELLDKLQK